MAFLFQENLAVRDEMFGIVPVHTFPIIFNFEHDITFPKINFSSQCTKIFILRNHMLEVRLESKIQR